MPNRIDTHSRMVAWAKIILPIIALGLLSTLFLLSNSVDPISTIPFSKADIEERTRNQQISSPEVFAVTSGGDFVSLNAEYARQSEENTDITIARDVMTKIKLASGASVDLAAGEAAYHAKDSKISLSDDVYAKTTLGYEFSAKAINVNMLELSVASEGAIKGKGPAMSLEAGQMNIEVPKGEKDAHLLFSEGVKLIYQPQKAGE